MNHLKEFEKRDGYYVIGLQEPEQGGTELVISVHPPREGGKPRSFSDEKPALAEQLPENVDWEAVSRAFETRKGTPEPVASVDSADAVSLPGLVFAGISRNATAAWVLFTEPLGSGEPVTVDRALEALQQAGARHGIDRQVLESALREGEPERAYLVAEATPAVKGEDSRVEYLVNVGARNIGPQVLADGSVDYKNVLYIDSVTPGQAIARKIPAGDGVDGTTVTGEAIKAKPGRDRDLKFSKGVQVNAHDPLTLEATVEGEVSVNRSGFIEVRNVLEVPGGVHYASGNISFKGNVMITGDVAAGFRVEATGDIRVTGTVEASELVAGGDVVVNGGFLGQDSGLIQAAGRATLSFVQGGKIVTEDDLVVTRGIVNSEVLCGGEVIATGTKGIILGGRVVAERGVRASVIGSEAFTPTVISVGLSKEIVEELQQINNRLDENRKKKEEAEKGLKTLKGMEAAIGLDERKRDIMNKLPAVLDTLGRSIVEDEDRLKELDEIVKSSRRAKVIATRVIYPGVRMFFSISTMKVTDPLHGVAVMEFNDEATFFSLKELEAAKA